MPAQLIALTGPLAGRGFALSAAPTVFGRNPDNAIVIASARASRRHAELRLENGAFVLYDLNSSNGTLVNGQRITRHQLRPGDLIDVGDETFRFDYTPDQPAAQPVPTPTLPAPQPQPQPAYQSPPPSYQPLPPVSALPPAQPPPRRGGCSLPVILLVGLLGACVLLAASVGGFFLFTGRSGTIGTSSTPEPVSSDATPGPAPTREAAAGDKEWTILVYIDADNDLESYSVIDFNEMEQVGSSDQVNVVAQFDRIASNEAWDDSSNGNWESAKRFLIERDNDDDEFNSKELEDLGEVDMGDPQTLADFIAWGVQSYPAKRYAVVISDHGSSWQGIASDETNDNNFLSLPDLQAALKAAQAEAKFGKLDLIGFDACLMAQVDVFQTVQPFASVAVASADLEPGDGWAWGEWLQILADNPEQDAGAVSKAIIDTYIDSYGGEDDRITLSSFNLEQFDQVVSSLDTLAQAMIGDMQGSYTAIGEARSYAEAYAQPQPDEVSAIDLGHFAELLQQQDAGSSVSEAANSVLQAIETTRIAQGKSRLHENSTGITVFFPQLKELYVDEYEQASPLPGSTKWVDFLQAFYEAGGASTLGAPAISDLSFESSTISVNSPASFQGTVSGENLAYVFFFAGTPIDNGNGVQLLAIDFVYPPGTTPSGDIPNWDDGNNAVNHSWQPVSWNMTNGSDTIPVLVGPLKYGSDTYGVEGIYTSQRSGEQIDIGLLFDVSQGRGELQRIWGFPRGQSQDLQPFELQPEPGDTFTALIRTYTDEGGILTPGLVEGQQITFGAQPMEVFTGPAPSGAYVAGLLVRDVSGNFAYQYEDITIDNSGAGQQVQPTPQADPQQGTQSGTLSYSNNDLGFSIDYPDTWQPYDSGNSRIVFANASEQDGNYLGVSVYSLEGSAEQANRAILEQLLQALSDKPGYEQRTEIESFPLAGQEGLTADFVYQNDAGELIYVGAIAVTNPETGLTYLVTIESFEQTYDQALPTFNAMLDTFSVR